MNRNLYTPENEKLEFHYSSYNSLIAKRNNNFISFQFLILSIRRKGIDYGRNYDNNRMIKSFFVIKAKCIQKRDHMQRITSINPCIIMGINQKNIARNETNYITEKFFFDR